MQHEIWRMIEQGEERGRNSTLIRQIQSGGGVDVGVIAICLSAFPPDLWLFLNGSTFDGTVYPALQDHIGGTTLPDWTDVFLIGAGSLFALGATGGEATHALTAGENGPHNHEYGYCEEHGVAGPAGGTVVTSTDSFTGLATTGPSGSGTPHNNIPPCVGVNFMIRAA